MANRKFVGFCLRYVKFFQRESRFGKKCIKYSEILRKKTVSLHCKYLKHEAIDQLGRKCSTK